MNLLLMPRTLPLRVVIIAGLVAAFLLVIPAGAADKVDGTPVESGDAPTLQLEPKAPPLSSFEFSGRIKITNKKVSFEAPPDYRESFSFWTEKMEGIVKEEKVEFITITRDPAADGTVPFRRQVPRYDLEIIKPGKHPAGLPNHIRRAVISKVWQGSLDRYGNVISIEETAGDEEETLKDLSFPFLNHLFPQVDESQVLAIGEAFTSRTKSDLPTRLTVSGLENTGLIQTRTYTLKEFGRRSATFRVTVSYEADPDRPPAREKTTCTISGTGAGEAIFDIEQGVFTTSKLGSTLTIDIEAPLRKLPTQAEDFDPGIGSTRIVLGIQMQGNRTVNKMF